MGSTRRFTVFRRMLKRETWRFKFFGTAFKWKRLNLQMSFLDTLTFKIMSVIEAIVLVSTLCFFYLCCGCHI